MSWFKKLKEIIPAGSMVLAVTTLTSYGVGLLRDRTFAHIFGASRLLDAYNAAFLLPDLLFNILVASGIAAACVPLFTELLHGDRERVREYANGLIAAACGVMVCVALVLCLFAGPISGLVAPGFSFQDQIIVARILRVLALSPLFFGVSNVLGAFLVAKKRFLYYGLSPVLYNAGIIGGALLLAPRWGITGVAVGTVIGAFLHFTTRWYDSYKSGFRFSTHIRFSSPEFKKTIELMIPKMFGHPVELATFWGFTAIASTLATGSVAVLNFARNFQSVPVSIIGITIATTTFPLLTQASADRSFLHFRALLARSFLLIVALSGAAAAAMYAVREPLIRILLGGGAFTAGDIKRTALTLGVFMLAVPTESLVQLFARGFYATKNTVTPVLLSVMSLIVAVVSARMLAPRFDIAALPLAFFIATGAEAVMLALLLMVRLRVLERGV